MLKSKKKSRNNYLYEAYSFLTSAKPDRDP